ncbi:MAG TPA: Gfo/Idh/MocA family oxidoreductase [Phycisphaerales bacterium]|nr:Gfo/Idh/MocA family oxidoreductase [Phycisphaerales bacterium]HMP35911.1 Gfo/Idh/MocA family oxidoreductase [Phycisphaerales bacterium]
MSLPRRDFIASTAGLAAVALMPEFLAAAPRAAEPMGLAVIGAGRQGRAIMGELTKLDAAKVVVVCDNDAGRLRSGLGRAAGAAGVENYREALDRDDVKAVVVATPTHLHRQIAIDSLAAGKHVYCEAPLASTVEDTAAIAEAAGKAATTFACGFEGRSNPVYRLARTFFRSDAVRALAAIRAQHMQKTSWRFPTSDPARERAVNWRLDPAVSTGLAGELFSHQVDVARWYTGQEPEQVIGAGSIRLWDDGRRMPDTVDLVTTFAGGARMLWLGSLASSYEGRHEVFFGENATIKLAWSHGWMFKEADAPTQGWEVYANRQQFHNDEGITLIADATKLASQGKLKEGIGLPNPSLYYALEDFLRACLERTEPACPAAEGAKSTLFGIKAHEAVMAVAG